jgi:hypothetical protein
VGGTRRETRPAVHAVATLRGPVWLQKRWDGTTVPVSSSSSSYYERREPETADGPGGVAEGGWLRLRPRAADGRDTASGKAVRVRPRRIANSAVVCAGGRAEILDWIHLAEGERNAARHATMTILLLPRPGGENFKCNCAAAPSREEDRDQPTAATGDEGHPKIMLKISK